MTSFHSSKTTFLITMTNIFLQETSFGESSQHYIQRSWGKSLNELMRKGFRTMKTMRRNSFESEMTCWSNWNRQHLNRVSLWWQLEKKNGRTIHLLKQKSKLEFKRKWSMWGRLDENGKNPMDDVFEEMKDFDDPEQ